MQRDEKSGHPIKWVTFVGPSLSGKGTLVGRLLHNYLVDPRMIRKFEDVASHLINTNHYYHGFLYYFFTRRLFGDNEYKTRYEMYEHKVLDVPEVINSEYIRTKVSSNERLIITQIPFRKCLPTIIREINICDICIVVVDGRIPDIRHKQCEECLSAADFILLAKLMQKELIICVTKIDDVKANDIVVLCNTLKKYCKKVNVKLVEIVPVSGFEGHNIGKLYDNNYSLQYHGKPLLEIILNHKPKVYWDTLKPFRMVIRNRYKIGGVGTVIEGRILSGTINKRDNIIVATNKHGVVNSIESCFEPIKDAKAGHFIGINVKGFSKNDIVRNFMVTRVDDQPLLPVSYFEAKIAILKALPQGTKVGCVPNLYCYGQHGSCKLEKIIVRLDRNTHKPIEGLCDSLKTGEMALVRIVPHFTTFLESFTDSDVIGRIILTHNNTIMAAGVVTMVHTYAPDNKVPLQ